MAEAQQVAALILNGLANNIQSSTPILHAPFFDGISGDVNEFLQQFEVTCVYNNWTTNEEKLRRLPAYLVQEAQRWFQQYQHATAAQNPAPTYAETTTALVARFRPTNYAQRIERQLRDRKWLPGETIESLHNSVLHLCHMMDPNMTEARKAEFLVLAVSSHPQLYVRIALQNITTPAGFMTSVQKIVEVLKVVDASSVQQLPPSTSLPVSNSSLGNVSLNWNQLREVIREETQNALASYGGYGNGLEENDNASVEFGGGFRGYCNYCGWWGHTTRFCQERDE